MLADILFLNSCLVTGNSQFNLIPYSLLLLIMKKSKKLIIHADDAGLCHSENRATMEALKKGMVNSCSIMVNCPWFYEMAEFARENPFYDYGIHLTLTCEWEKYKFGPVLPVSEVSSLVDENGYFYRNRDLLREHAVVSEVKKELIAQIERGLKFGINPSHIDSHMYSLGARADLFEVYKDLGRVYNIPILLNRELMEMVGLDYGQNLGEEDLVIDKTHYGNFGYFKEGKLKEYYRSIFDNLVDGVNLILIHPAFDDAEMKAVTINHPNFGSEWRQIDFDYFTSQECRSILDERNITLVNWKDLKK